MLKRLLIAERGDFTMGNFVGIYRRGKLLRTLGLNGSGKWYRLFVLTDRII